MTFASRPTRYRGRGFLGGQGRGDEACDRRWWQADPGRGPGLCAGADDLRLIQGAWRRPPSGRLRLRRTAGTVMSSPCRSASRASSSAGRTIAQSHVTYAWNPRRSSSWTVASPTPLEEALADPVGGFGHELRSPGDSGQPIDEDAVGSLVNHVNHMLELLSFSSGQSWSEPRLLTDAGRAAARAALRARALRPRTNVYS